MSVPSSDPSPLATASVATPLPAPATDAPASSVPNPLPDPSPSFPAVAATGPSSVPADSKVYVVRSSVAGRTVFLLTPRVLDGETSVPLPDGASPARYETLLRTLELGMVKALVPPEGGSSQVEGVLAAETVLSTWIDAGTQLESKSGDAASAQDASFSFRVLRMKFGKDLRMVILFVRDCELMEELARACKRAKFGDENSCAMLQPSVPVLFREVDVKFWCNRMKDVLPSTVQVVCSRDVSYFERLAQEMATRGTLIEEYMSNNGQFPCGAGSEELLKPFLEPSSVNSVVTRAAETGSSVQSPPSSLSSTKHTGKRKADDDVDEIKSTPPKRPRTDSSPHSPTAPGSPKGDDILGKIPPISGVDVSGMPVSQLTLLQLAHLHGLVDEDSRWSSRPFIKRSSPFFDVSADDRALVAREIIRRNACCCCTRPNSQVARYPLCYICSTKAWEEACVRDPTLRTRFPPKNKRS